MAKINSFIIMNIESINDKEFRLSVKNGKEKHFYRANFPVSGSVVFSDDLEVLMMGADFNYHKEFMKLLVDYRKGTPIQFPVVLSNNQKEAGRAFLAA
jgi:hypothetical protein